MKILRKKIPNKLKKKIDINIVIYINKHLIINNIN